MTLIDHFRRSLPTIAWDSATCTDTVEVVVSGARVPPLPAPDQATDHVTVARSRNAAPAAAADEKE
ncbi:hypothetical protein [Salinispora pacifica]|uniref:hypothetical protein n=1 Tax=Salinispora pacifica TaxID=351187 RepID=UPI000476CBA5|nr:hypothetical protein [Salinispora pacifica]